MEVEEESKPQTLDEAKTAVDRFKYEYKVLCETSTSWVPQQAVSATIGAARQTVY